MRSAYRFCISPRESTQKNAAESLGTSSRIAGSSAPMRSSPGSPRQQSWRMRARTKDCFTALLRRSLEVEQTHGVHRPLESVQLHVAQVLGEDELLDLGEDALRDEDVPRLGEVAQAVGEVGDVADRAVVDASLEADRAHRRVALRDADAESQRVAALLPLRRELER